jgi:hypothetical protein
MKFNFSCVVLCISLMISLLLLRIVTDLLKAFLSNGSVNTANVQQWKV